MSIAKVQSVFRDVFQRPDLVIKPDMTAKDVPEWDSFNHINLILGLEMAFDISFTTEEIASMARIDDLIVILRERGLDVAWDE